MLNEEKPLPYCARCFDVSPARINGKRATTHPLLLSPSSFRPPSVVLRPSVIHPASPTPSSSTPVFFHDVLIYDGLDQIIVTAGLVPPKPGIFVDEVKYVLVLATPVEIVLQGVCFEGNNVFGDVILHPITVLVEGLLLIVMFAAQTSISSDGVNMLKTVGTQNGRILAAGKDGNLYEILLPWLLPPLTLWIARLSIISRIVYSQGGVERSTDSKVSLGGTCSFSREVRYVLRYVLTALMN